MSLADERFEQFVDSIRAGRRVDHNALFDGLDRGERLELTDLIEGFAASERSAPVDLDRFESTRNDDPNLERLGRAMNGVSGMWPAALPRLRNRAQLGRDELVSKLADEIGTPDSREKVEEYYHRMEWGSLPAGGVNDKVVDSLAGILGADPAELRKSGDFRGSASRESVADESPAVFARLVGPGQAADAPNASASPDAGNEMTDLPSPDDWDETDRLFLGG
ncbi:MAG: hypothetical protein WCO96_08230 [Actinomycetes bacterium]